MSRISPTSLLLNVGHALDHLLGPTVKAAGFTTLLLVMAGLATLTTVFRLASARSDDDRLPRRGLAGHPRRLHGGLADAPHIAVDIPGIRWHSCPVMNTFLGLLLM